MRTPLVVLHLLIAIPVVTRVRPRLRENSIAPRPAKNPMNEGRSPFPIFAFAFNRRTAFW